MKNDGNVEALNGVSFVVGKGEVVGLLGVNGAGKSTLVRILSTLLKPDRGTVAIHGHDLLRNSAGVRRSIGVALQEVGLDESRAVGRVVLMHARIHGLSRRDSHKRVAWLLESLGLQEVARQRISELSGGTRRRVDLALALVHKPPVVLLDEPTVGLDPRSRVELWQQIQQLRSAGTAILLTTQHINEADRLADRVVILSRGRVVEQGAPAELKKMIRGSALELTFDRSHEAERAVACLGRPGLHSGTSIRWIGADVDELRQALSRLHAHGIRPASAGLTSPTLEDLFFQKEDSEAGRAGW